MLTFLHSARLQSFDNTGRLLNGGKIRTYALGTTTPKVTYSDINGNSPNTNPVILDSVGSASIYLNGSYTLWLYDENDVQIGPPVDVLGGINDFITSGGSGSFADNIVISVNTYNDVRNISNPYSFIFVQGREYQADGGEGIFVLDQSSTEADDDGITLAPQTAGRYIRLNLKEIDPRWFGLVYGVSTDQTSFVQAADTASIRYALPINYNGSVYINQANSVYGQYIFTNNSKFLSTLSVNLIFKTGSSAIIGKHIFGNSVQPIFESNVVDIIRYSYMDADNIQGRVTKLLNCSSYPYKLEFDEDITTSVAPQIPYNFELMYTGQVVSISGASNLSFKTNYTGIGQLFSYTSPTYIQNVSISGSTSRPEWFGNDNNIAFKACAKTGKMLVSDKTYTITSAFCTNDLIIVGDPENSISSNAKIVLSASNSTPFISNTNTFLKNINLESTAKISTTVFSADSSYISATTSAISATYVSLESCSVTNEDIITGAAETDRYYANVQFLNDQYKRRFQGFSTFRDVYLLNNPGTQYATFLTTNYDCKVVSTTQPYIDAVSANSIQVDRLDIRFNYETLIEYRWRNNLGTPYCAIYRDGVFQYEQANPLTATYTPTSADEKNIVVNITGSSIGTSQITLTSANSGISSRYHDINILSMTSNVLQIGGDLFTTGMILPNGYLIGKNGINAQYYYTSKKWFLI